MVPPPFRLPVIYVPQIPQMVQPKKTSRVKFTSEEDQKLKELVARYGESNWNEVSAKLGTRTARQCRERFKNYLSPSIKNDPWTEEDDKLLKEKYKEYGPKWSLIASFFPSRSDVNIKNHWTRLNNKYNRDHDLEAEKRELIQQINMVIESNKKASNISAQNSNPILEEDISNISPDNNKIEYPSFGLPNLPMKNDEHTDSFLNKSPNNFSSCSSDFDLSSIEWDCSEDPNSIPFFDDCSYI